MTIRCAFPRLASVHDAWDVYIRGYGTHEWPPPATTVYSTPHDRFQVWSIVCGDLDEQQVGATYWCTLYELYDPLPIPSIVATQVAKLLGASSRLTGVITVIGHWPAIYTVGRGLEDMRWMRVTLRGTLGSIEQFQHKFDFRALSEATYDTDEAGAQVTANNIKTRWTEALSFADGVSGGALLGRLGGTVAYTEVGVTVLHQDAAGGDPVQEIPTGWSPWAATSRPTGGGITPLPNEVACCVTLQSDTRGARGRGRTYLPPFGVLQMANDGTFLDAAVAAAGRCVNKFLQLMTTDGGVVPVVVSLAGGASHEITSASIGKVPDSQRRRRRSQLEANALVWSA